MVALPTSFVLRMQAQLGTEYPEFEQAFLKKPPTSIRTNPEKNHRMSGLPIPWCTHGLYIHERPVFTLDPLFHGGTYYVQEASSMLLEQAIKQTTEPDKPIVVLDLCAAPGGKSTHLLSLLPKDSLLVCNEVIRSRATILAENIQKWGYGNAVVTNNDPEDFHSLKGLFDVVVIDAPCSGEGLFRKDENACGEWSTENAELCALRQQRILRSIWPSLKEGGVLIYSTCTYNPDENELNIKQILEGGDAENISLSLNPDWGVVSLKNGYQCYPHRLEGEGFYLVAIRKVSPSETVHLRSKKDVARPGKGVAESVRNWIHGSFLLRQHLDLIIAIPEKHHLLIEFLSSALKVIHRGTAIGIVKHEKIIPDHGLALSIHLKKESFLQMSVSLEQARIYLKKDTFYQEHAAKGHALVIYEDNPIGWVNLLGNRINNLYPTEWRIRMSL